MAAAAAAAERACDRNMAIFMQSIRDSDNVACTAIVAIKARAPFCLWLAATSAQHWAVQTPLNRWARMRFGSPEQVVPGVC